MKVFKNKIIIAGIIFILLLIFIYGLNQITYLQKVHSTFENYYAFRDCATLIKKTNQYGVCRTESGQTIKIVKFRGKWYLDGDLPCGFLCF